jgi:hypothetical protein
MYQVSPEDQLQVVNDRQAEWRSQSGQERLARTAPVPAEARRSYESSGEGRISHHVLVHAAHLLRALMPRHGTGGPRPAH